MWPLGHAAIAYLLYSGSTHARHGAPPGAVAVLVVLFGSLFPDLVDKPLAWYAGVLPNGRTLAHSLLVLVPLCLAVFLIARRYGRSEYGVAFAVGALSHSLVDAVPVLWDPEANADFLFYPLTGGEPYEGDGAPGVVDLFLSSLSDPYFLSEFAFASLALALWVRDGYPGLALLRTRVSRYVPRLERPG